MIGPIPKPGANWQYYWFDLSVWFMIQTMYFPYVAATKKPFDFS